MLIDLREFRIVEECTFGTEIGCILRDAGEMGEREGREPEIGDFHDPLEVREIIDFIKIGIGFMRNNITEIFFICEFTRKGVFSFREEGDKDVTDM